jgi:hypothetical protein
VAIGRSDVNHPARMLATAPSTTLVHGLLAES